MIAMIQLRKTPNKLDLTGNSATNNTNNTSNNNNNNNNSQIPVPKSPGCSPRLQERIAGLRPVGHLQRSTSGPARDHQNQNHSGHGHQAHRHHPHQGNKGNKATSVAAQRAAFERLDNHHHHHGHHQRANGAAGSGSGGFNPAPLGLRARRSSSPITTSSSSSMANTPAAASYTSSSPSIVSGIDPSVVLRRSAARDQYNALLQRHEASIVISGAAGGGAAGGTNATVSGKLSHHPQQQQLKEQQQQQSCVGDGEGNKRKSNSSDSGNNTSSFCDSSDKEPIGGIGTCSGNINNSSSSKWKNRFEDTERRRKMLLQRSEAVNRENMDLEKKYQQIVNQNAELQTRLREKDENLEKMRSVSEAVCKEYEQLKIQHELETGAMHKAIQQASEWYRQNRELKRMSQALTQRYLQNNPDFLNDLQLPDEVDTNSDDIDQLRESVTELSKKVAQLQTELNSAKLQEFEAQEQVTQLTAQLEEERQARQIDGDKIKELEAHKQHMERISKKVAEEVDILKVQCDREKENARQMKLEAHKAQKERNVLAHQSALLMADVGDDPNGRVLVLLQEIETLKRSLEEEKQSHAVQIQLLQEKLEEKEANVEFEIVEEKLKLAESELEVFTQKANRAEKSSEDYKEKMSELETKIADLERRIAVPVPPPPPPPPPLPPMNFSNSSTKLIIKERMNNENNPSAISDMENMLGITKKTPHIPQQPAIDDIINQIKGGRFTLKHTNKQKEDKKKEESPPALSEMLNILGTMRRRSGPKRNSIKSSN